jgi:hypothetical protein
MRTVLFRSIARWSNHIHTLRAISAIGACALVLAACGGAEDLAQLL